MAKLILSDAISIAWYRMVIAVVVIVPYMIWRNKSFRIGYGEFFKLAGVGLVVAAHWIFFFQAVKVSNVSVTLVSFSTITLFTSIIEPAVKKTKIFWLDVLIGLFILLGIYMIFRFESDYTLGIIFGLLSAITASLFTVMNEQLIKKHDSSTLSFYELLAGAVGIGIFVLMIPEAGVIDFDISLTEVLYLSFLGIICTAFTFIVFVEIMRKLSSYVVNLSINMEPIYGILFAYAIFGEEEKMTLGFYAGTLVIMGSVFAYPVLNRKLGRYRRESNTN